MAIVPVQAVLTVTTAGTRQQFTTSSIASPYIRFEALGTNTNPVFIGLSTVSATVYIARLAAGTSITLQAPTYARGLGSEFDLTAFWADVTTNGEKISWTYLPRV